MWAISDFLPKLQDRNSWLQMRSAWAQNKVRAASAVTQMQLGRESGDIATALYIERAETVAGFAEHLNEMVS